MIMNVPPTRTSSLRITQELRFATEGFDLLDQKRQILLLELMQYVDAARREQEEADRHLAEAYKQLRAAAEQVGTQRLATDALATPIETSVNVTEHRVMGISVPQVEASPAKVQPTFSFGSGTIRTDNVMASFKKALEAISRLAETQNAVFRLARELRKTQRRVNALSKNFIPTYKDTLTYITATLEERERESFVIMRMIRDRLRKGEPEQGAAE